MTDRRKPSNMGGRRHARERLGSIGPSDLRSWSPRRASGRRTPPPWRRSRTGRAVSRSGRWGALGRAAPRRRDADLVRLACWRTRHRPHRVAALAGALAEQHGEGAAVTSCRARRRRRSAAAAGAAGASRWHTSGRGGATGEAFGCGTACREAPAGPSGGQRQGASRRIAATATPAQAAAKAAAAARRRRGGDRRGGARAKGARVRRQAGRRNWARCAIRASEDQWSAPGVVRLSRHV